MRSRDGVAKTDMAAHFDHLPERLFVYTSTLSLCMNDVLEVLIYGSFLSYCLLFGPSVARMKVYCLGAVLYGI